MCMISLDCDIPQKNYLMWPKKNIFDARYETEQLIYPLSSLVSKTPYINFIGYIDYIGMLVISIILIISVSKTPYIGYINYIDYIDYIG